MKRFLLLTAVSALVAGCAVSFPFDTEVEGTTFPLPTTAGLYVERVISAPSETQNANVTISELTINYTISNNTIFTGDIEIYIGLETVADTDSSDATLVLSRSVPANQVVTGSVTPDILKEAVKQSAFVVGLKNVSISGLTGDDITFSYSIRAKGSYSL